MNVHVQFSKLFGMNLKIQFYFKLRDLEFQACKDVIDERDGTGDHTRALYAYPPDIDSYPDLPLHLKDQLISNNNLNLEF